MLPEIERLGVAAVSEVDIGTLSDRIMQETVEACALLVGRSEIGAWCRR
jgi:hypothetical protein